MKKETKIGYKIVCLEKGHYYSFSAPRSGAVRYRKDCFTRRKPHCGLLAIFKRFQDVRNFAFFENPIFKCEYVPSNDNYLWSHDKKRVMTHELPPGTGFANKVKLLERVTWSI